LFSIVMEQTTTVTPKHQNSSEKLNSVPLNGFGDNMKRSAATSQPKRLPLRPIVVAATILFLIVSLFVRHKCVAVYGIPKGKKFAHDI
jgi:hypothetical protein